MKNAIILFYSSTLIFCLLLSCVYQSESLNKKNPNIFITPSPSNTNTPDDYLVAITIPAYDANNPKHFLITPANNGFNQINNSAYDYFYVEPGAYGTVTLTQSGTAQQSKYLLLFNGNDIHPGKLDSNQQADV